MRGKGLDETAHRGLGRILNQFWVPGWSMSELLAGWGTGLQLCGFSCNRLSVLITCEIFRLQNLLMSVPAEMKSEKVKQYVNRKENKPDF